MEIQQHRLATLERERVRTDRSSAESAQASRRSPSYVDTSRVTRAPMAEPRATPRPTSGSRPNGDGDRPIGDLSPGVAPNRGISTNPPIVGDTPILGKAFGHSDAQPADPSAATDSAVLVSAAVDERRETPIEKRIVVHNATLDLTVGDVTQALHNAEKLAADFGGYVQKIEDAQITMRIPAVRFNDAVARIEALGHVEERKLEALDVTGEFVDLEARLKNAQSVQTRLRAMLEKAEDVKTALEVEKELKRLNEEIETLTARLELMKSRIAYSTIAIRFAPVARQTTFARNAHLPFRWLWELQPERLFNH